MFKLNKYLLLLIAIICLLSISAVSAIDSNDNLQLSNDVKNFTYLNDTIQGQDVVELNYDIVKNPNEGFVNGIQIKKSVTINGNGHYIDANYLGQIFAIKNQSANFVLNNLTLKNGKASVASAINADFGAYVYLNDCYIINNGNYKNSSSVSYIYGGAIKVGNIFCTNTIFDGNYISRLNSTSSGYGYGGAICIYNGNNVNLTNCTFNNNYVEGVASFNYVMGAVLYFDVGGKSALNIINSSFNNNYIYNVNSKNQLSGYAMGATIYTESDQTYIYNSTFSNNNLKASVVYGGAIQVDNNYKKNNITVSSSTFNNNSCIGDKGYGGALYIDDYSDIFIYSSIFDGNFVITTDKAYGGAIYCIYRSNKNVFVVDNSSFINNYLESVNEVYGAGMVYPYTDYGNNVQLNITNTNFENNIINITSPTKKAGGAGLVIGGNSYAIVENVTFKNNKFVGKYALDGYGDGLYIKTKLLVSCQNVSFIGNSLYNVGNTDRKSKLSNNLLLTSNDNAIVATLILITYSFDDGSKIINDGVLEVKQINNFTELQNVLNLISSRDKLGANAGILILNEDINKTKEEESSFEDGAIISSDIQIDGKGVTVDANNSGSLFKIKEGVTASFRDISMVNPGEDVAPIINNGNVGFGEVCNFTTLDMAINLIENNGVLVLLNDIYKNGTELTTYLGGINITKPVIIDGQGKYGINPVVGKIFNQSSLITYRNIVFFAGSDFTSLNESISNAINSGSYKVRLSENITKQSSEYSTFANGIIINNNVIIEGNDYSLNSANGCLFTVNPNCNLTLTNIKLNNTGVAINNNGRVIFDVTSNKINVIFSDKTNKILNGPNAYVRINNTVTFDQFYNVLNLINHGSNDLNIEFYRIYDNDNFNTIEVNGNFNLIAFKSGSSISYYGSKIVFDVKKGAILKISNVTSSISTNNYNFIHNNGTVILESCTISNKLILNNGTVKMNFNNFNSFSYAIHAINGGILVLTSNVVNNGYSYIDIENYANLTIDGNGFIVDANSKSIFNIANGANITLKNMVLVNSVNYAINNKGNLSIMGCTFKNNTATNLGGLITNNEGNLSVSGCIYKNNNKGAMIYTYLGSLYLNNIAVSNSNEVLVISNGTNIRSKVTAVVLNNSTLKAKLGYNYTIDVVYYDDNNNIIAILNNSTVLFDGIEVGNYTNEGYHSLFNYTAIIEGNIVVSVNCSELSDLDIKIGIINVNSKDSFYDLQELINKNSTINLTSDVVYNPIWDFDYKNGLIINKTITIIGNGFIIDASKIAIFFNIKENGSLNLVNINLINASEIAIVNYGNLSLNNVSTKGRILNNGIISSEVIVNVYGGKLTTFDSFVVVLKNKNGNNIIVPKLIITDDQGHKYTSYIYYKGLYIFYVPEGITGHVTFNHSTVNGFTNVSSSGYLDISKYPQNNFKGVLNKVVKNTINSIKTVNLPNLVKNFDYNFQLILNFLR